MLEPSGHVDRLGGRLVQWRMQPGAHPPIVLLSGCGLAMEFWRDVVDRMPERMVVAYDRPGMGGTPWPGHLPTLAEEVGTLHDLIVGLDAGPVVLVAHSMASFHAEAFAREFPNLVAGIVMLDGSVEFMVRAPRAASSKPARAVAHAVDNFGMGQVGLLAWRLGALVDGLRSYRRLGQGRLPAIYRDADSLAMGTAESFAYAEQAWDLLQVRRNHSWGPIPVIVLSATGGEARRNLDKQQRLAHLLGGRQETIEDTRHMLMLDRPDAVVDAVDELAPLSEGDTVG